MPKRDLTPKQERFCEEYIVDMNGTQAVLRAGYKMKENAAKVQASQLLTKPNVKKYIEMLRNRQSRRTEITADMVLKELGKIAFADLADIYDKDGRLLTPHEMSEDARAAVAGIDVLEEWDGRGQDRVQIGETKKVKRTDKVRALELLGKHFKMFTEKHEVTGQDGTPLGSLGEDEVNAQIKALAKELGDDLLKTMGYELED